MNVNTHFSDVFLCLHCNTIVSVSILPLFIIDRANSVKPSRKNSGLRRPKNSHVAR